MEKFWIVAVANTYNPLSERFYTYDDAKKEADRRAQMSPDVNFLVLELKGFARGTKIVDSVFESSDAIEVIELNKDDVTKITLYFTDDVGNKLDLSNCSVQFIVLPTPTTDYDNAMLNQIKTFVPTEEQLTPDTFTGNKADFIISSDVTKNTGMFWYKVILIYHTDPEESVVYKENNFIVK